MKNLLIIALLAITSLGANAQPPMQQMQRPLSNQFRDFVDHQQMIGRPQIEHKDGKVIITMSEQQFRARQLRLQRAIIKRNERSCPCQRRQEPMRRYHKR
jgi:hypothetical protein